MNITELRLLSQAHNLPASLAERLRFDVEQTLKGLYADESLADRLDDLYLPFARWVSQYSRPKHQPLVLGMGGPQGCGKTTFCAVVSHILAKGFDLNAVVVSLDDLYLTQKDRLAYAETAHPLFATRGVPGTHDTQLALTIFDRLKHLQEGEVMYVPKFDKSLDDRKPVHRWQEVAGPVDVIFFEGWCVGASPMSEESLNEPINRLEADKDADASWRHAVNEQLQQDYKRLFELIDVQMWMQPPSFDVVYDWRNKQERVLEAHLHDIHGGVLDTLDIKVMSPEALKGFMQYYERITRHMICSMAQSADVHFMLDEHQTVIKTKLPRAH
ncbi:hypothetical protein [Marinomonas ostreistagni]|uniref:hypothetical protein n=1 Tax=Marinomonas ostreistagni TaxID=359209 RepID=UPI00194E78A4|nr:hypothetical protein [Marinomonas ostreistagni]MBM6552163.1 hypothetical protein [Marinomonas ostreistagni]